jgi:hypothetical protein
MMKDKIGKNIQWIKRVKKILANSSDEIKKKNQDYGFNDEIKNKLKFDKGAKNKNLKPKYWGPKPKISSNIELNG